MPMFQDFLAGLRGEDGSLTIGESFEGDATAAYDADMNGSQAAIAELQSQLQSLQLELQAAQAANWILVQDGYGLDGSPAAAETDSDPDNAQTDPDDDDEEITDSDDEFLGSDDDDDK
ncbi:scaffolding protein [Curtobacterium phage Ayka]|nr:scaffolding protein [Curtobacterium phage Ayka]